MTDFHSFVRRRLSYSLFWSTAARVTTCLLQIVSIPIAVKYLGVEGYAAFAAIFALSLGPHAFVLRHGPSLTGPVAVLLAKNDWLQIREKLWSAFIPSLITAIAAGTVFVGLYFAGIVSLTGSLAMQSASASIAALFILAFVNLINVLANVFDEIQAGMQDSHIQGIRSTLGNIGALACIFLLVPYWPNIFVYAAAITVPPVLLRFANVALILRQFPQLCPERGVVTFRSMMLAFQKGFLFTLVAGFGVYATFRSPVLASATFLGVHETASISIINQFIQVGYIFGTVLSLAFVPAINASIAAGQMGWVIRSVRRLELFMVIMSVLGIIAFCGLGPKVHQMFLKEHLHVPDNCLLFAGFFTAALVAENLYFQILLSLRPTSKLVLLLIARALATGMFSFIACRYGYPSGIWASGAVLIFVSSAVPFRQAVYSELRRAAEMETQNVLGFAAN